MQLNSRYSSIQFGSLLSLCTHACKRKCGVTDIVQRWWRQRWRWVDCVRCCSPPSLAARTRWTPAALSQSPTCAPRPPSRATQSPRRQGTWRGTGRRTTRPARRCPSSSRDWSSRPRLRPRPRSTAGWAELQTHKPRSQIDNDNINPSKHSAFTTKKARYNKIPLHQD